PPRKRWGASRIDKFSASQFSFVPAPSQTCFGDSGGPAFAQIGGVEYLIGITSTGDPECISGGTDVRVGAFEAGFVEGYLSGASVGPTVEGGCSAAPGAHDGSGFALLALAALGLLWSKRVGAAPAAVWRRRNGSPRAPARSPRPSVAQRLLESPRHADQNLADGSAGGGDGGDRDPGRGAGGVERLERSGRIDRAAPLLALVAPARARRQQRDRSRRPGAVEDQGAPGAVGRARAVRRQPDRVLRRGAHQRLLRLARRVRHRD